MVAAMVACRGVAGERVVGFCFVGFLEKQKAIIMVER
jgi:hypothetical protein